MAVLVPAYSTVSCSENPTRSLASTRRRLRQVRASTSRSVPTMSSSVLTIKMNSLPRGAVPGRRNVMRRYTAIRTGRRRTGHQGNEIRKEVKEASGGLQFAGRGHRFGEDLQTLGEFLLGRGDRRQQLDHLALRTGGLHQQVPFVRRGAHLAREGGVFERDPAGQAAAADLGTRVAVVRGDLLEGMLDLLALDHRLLLEV